MTLVKKSGVFKVTGILAIPENAQYIIAADNVVEEAFYIQSERKPLNISTTFNGEPFKVNGDNVDNFLNTYFPDEKTNRFVSGKEGVSQESVDQAATSIMETAQMIKAKANEGR